MKDSQFPRWDYFNSIQYINTQTIRFEKRATMCCELQEYLTSTSSIWEEHHTVSVASRFYKNCKVLESILWCLYWTLSSPSCTNLTSNLMLSSNCIPNFPTSIPAKTLYLILSISFLAICPAHHSCLDFTTVLKQVTCTPYICQITANCSSQYRLRKTMIVNTNI